MSPRNTEKLMPRQKVEVIVEFECDNDTDLDDVLSVVCEAVEGVVLSATNCFSDIANVEEI